MWRLDCGHADQLATSRFTGSGTLTAALGKP